MLLLLPFTLVRSYAVFLVMIQYFIEWMKLIYWYLGSERRNVSVLLGGKQSDLSLLLGESLHISNPIDSIAPADFNGDGNIDILLTSKFGTGN